MFDASYVLPFCIFLSSIQTKKVKFVRISTQRLNDTLNCSNATKNYDLSE